MEHYYSAKPESALVFTKVRFSINGHDFSLVSASGLFSHTKLDNGTRLLIEAALEAIGDAFHSEYSVLDLGCGYGAAGIAVAKLRPRCRVLMSDVNERACMVAKINLKEQRLENAYVVQSDGFEKINSNFGKFDVILLNPPQSAGMALCRRLIAESRERLAKGGRLLVVARHRKGGSRLQSFMKEVFEKAGNTANVSVVRRGSGFQVYCAEKE